MSDLDRRAILDGAAVAAMVAVPVQIIARIAVDEDERSGWSTLLILVLLGGLVLGAGVAAWHQDRRTPLTHGLVTSVGVFVTIQAVFTVLKAVQGDTIHWGKILVSLTLSGVAGVVGGLLGSSMLRTGAVPQRGRR